ncbi:MAG TPA: aminoacyl-tRNA hydrolase [Candidatus Kapabacteria bacterium]|nr:aminoacyl-tRNA hydrolase [Candidatus Kapabacteria bacterium]
MKVVLALGNPGARYAATRHNIGWMIADAVAGRLGCDFVAGRGDYYAASARVGDEDLLIVKPTTYMNNSGVAAAQIVERFGVPVESILAIVDELQFATGRIQLRPSGSSGGHNGTESLIYHLDSINFPRLRCGIGNEFPSGMMADYVLSPFPREEHALVEKMIEEGADAVITWVREGTGRAMNLVNTRRQAETKNDAAGTGDGPQAREDGTPGT